MYLATYYIHSPHLQTHSLTNLSTHPPILLPTKYLCDVDVNLTNILCQMHVLHKTLFIVILFCIQALDEDIALTPNVDSTIMLVPTNTKQ